MPIPSTAELEDAYRYCDNIARQRARNFYPAFRFLTRERRSALSAYYAFCSLSDDIADENQSTVEEKRQKLDAWRTSLKQCINGDPETPLFLALADAISRFNLPPQPFFDLLEGIEMDFTSRRYQTFDDLIVYCRRVASSVGLVSVRIFGCTEPGADEYADALGIAFQLTNIMRDISEDIQRDRIYLPTEDLERFEYSEDDLKSAVYDQRFISLMQFQYERALSCFDQAQPDLAGKQRRYLLTAEIMSSVYLRVLDEMKRQKFNVLNHRISIPKWRMAAGIARTLGRHFILSR